MNVRTLCLGILVFGDATGYEIKKKVEHGMFSHFIEASYGSIYPALSALCAEGLLTCKAESQEGRPGKKIYAITEDGRRVLSASLSTSQVQDKFKSEFLFASLLSELLPKSLMNTIYEKRLEYMRNELKEIEQHLQLNDHPGAHFVGGYGQAVLEAGLAYLEKNKPASLNPPKHAAE